MKNYLFSLFSVLILVNETYICQTESFYNSGIIYSLSEIDCFKLPTFDKKLKKCLKPITVNFFDLDVENAEVLIRENWIVRFVFKMETLYYSDQLIKLTCDWFVPRHKKIYKNVGT